MSFARMLKRRKAQDPPAPPAGGQHIEINVINLLCQKAADIFSKQNNPYVGLFRDVSEFFPESVEGERFSIKVRDVSPAEALSGRLESVLTGRLLSERFDDAPHRSITLFDNLRGQAIMTNGFHELRTNAAAVARARGDILILGLGIGLLPVAIQDKPEVKSCTIVELSQEIIDLISSRVPLNGKIRIFQGDAFDWQPEPGQMFDFVYGDLWNVMNKPEIFLEMESLRAHYRPHLAAGGEIRFWEEGEAAVNHYRVSHPAA